MPVAALVLTLDPDAALAARARALLATDPRLTLGDAVDGRLPVVVESATLGDGASLTRELEAQPGVRFVDVVMVDFSDFSDEV